MNELEDRPWFPALLRNYQTEFIGTVAIWLKVYDRVVERLRSRTTAVPMVDLCAGSGEPAITIFRHCAAFSSLTLTDKYPGRALAPGVAHTYAAESVDVLDLAFAKGTCYTMFNAFHHFPDAEKLRIIRRLRQSGSEACFVELLEPTLACMVKVVLMTTVGTVLLTPFVPPFSLGRLFFTYIIPINVVTITYDGVVSVLRARSARQLTALFDQEGGSVQVTRLAGGVLPLTLIEVRHA